MTHFQLRGFSEIDETDPPCHGSTNLANKELCQGVDLDLSIWIKAKLSDVLMAKLMMYCFDEQQVGRRPRDALGCSGWQDTALRPLAAGSPEASRAPQVATTDNKPLLGIFELGVGVGHTWGSLLAG